MHTTWPGTPFMFMGCRAFTYPPQVYNEMVRTLLFILCLLLPAPALASEINAGFVDGLWYATAEPFADVPTRIYVAVRNNTDRDLTGTVEFFVDGERIGRDSVQVISGRIIEAWADWTPRYGEHTVSARLSRVVVNAVGSSAEEAVAETVLAEDTIFIDYDTDTDGVPNERDEDDDNDTMSDEAERERGSNPLLPEPKPVSTPQDETKSNGATDKDSSVTDEKDEQNDGPEGLEQYLTDSRAKSTLSSVTNFITTTKSRVDTYRETRDVRIAAENETTQLEDKAIEESPSPVFTPQSGTTTSVGEITRSKAEPRWYNGLTTKIIDGVQHILQTGFTVLLAGVSWALGHPILLQIALLILILFLFLKLARRLSRRPG